jgi:hypothetical protein
MDYLSKECSVFKKKQIFIAIVWVSAVLIGYPQIASAVVVGQTDTFENGTPQGWIAGFFDPHPPVNVATGGPQGVGDHYLKVTSSGGLGAGSKLVTFSTTQWTGNYTTAGIVAIGMDLNNLGNTGLVIRLAINGPGGEIASLNGVSLPPGGGWNSVKFSVTAADFAKTLSTGNIAATLAGVTELRILHCTTPQYEGTVIAAVLGIDNIKAMANPPVCGDLKHPYPVGDLNKDCYVDLQDLVLWAGEWMAANCALTNQCNDADLDGNGEVHLADFALMAADWLKCTNPEPPCSFNP